ncbi:MAG: ATP-dependent DNA helicase DinG [Pseudohongiellaceae bacterium]
MLADELKSQIQALYRQMLDSRQLTPRYGQRQMIAEIARTLGVLCADGEQPSPVCVVEAGTGTGKTLAYLLAVLPLARALEFKVVIATATVALQEQVLYKDIPELQQGCDLNFSVALAKGRGRYLCLARLEQLLRGNDSAQAMLDLYGEELEFGGGNPMLYDKMMQALSAGDWQGDRDDWPEPVIEADWRPLTVDNSQCTGARCSHFRRCCFYRARDALDTADCIVTNHDLVLSDLTLGGGVILPPPEECLYIFDEAHHLPVKSNNHFSGFARVQGSLTWLERSEAVIRQMRSDELIDAALVKSLERPLRQSGERLRELHALLDDYVAQLDSVDHYDNRSQHTFTLGRVPEGLRQQAEQLANLFAQLQGQFERVEQTLKDILDDDSQQARQPQAEQWLPLAGNMLRRTAAALELWSQYATADPGDVAPVARWLNYVDSESNREFTLAASPVLAAENLQTHLWQRCGGAVLTSATLSALGSFETLRMRAGLPAHTHYVSIPSPFNFAAAARLVIPRLACDPSDTERHTAALIRAIPQLLNRDCAALMLFSSRRQMQDVLEGLTEEWRELVLCQDDYQKAQLIKFHRQRVDEGKGSIIFGLASFAEGVDLPGKYCTHVLIARIPFAVPNDPVEMTLAAWVEQQGRNAFMTLAVPDAAFRLLQASGRLLRSETDTGQITLFDERIINRRYGRQILDSLPPYTREVFQVEVT